MDPNEITLQDALMKLGVLAVRVDKLTAALIDAHAQIEQLRADAEPQPEAGTE